MKNQQLLSGIKMSKKKTLLLLRARAQVKAVARLLYERYFPYPHLLVVAFPFFALLISNGVISADNGLPIFYLLPCLFTLMALYVYNDLCDSKTDTIEKNPISRGELQKNVAVLCTVLFTLFAVVSAVAIYRSPLAIGVLFSFIFFSLAYSGLKTRFKTTMAGPFVASYVLWTAPSLALIAEFSFLNNVAVCLLCGIFLVFTSHELHHQIGDFALDKEKKVKTFAVKFGLKKAFLFTIILSVSGFLLLGYSIHLTGARLYAAVLPLIPLFLFFHILLAFTKHIIIKPNIPVKLILIAFACEVLEFPPLLTLLVLLIFLAEIYSYVQTVTLQENSNN